MTIERSTPASGSVLTTIGAPLRELPPNTASAARAGAGTAAVTRTAAVRRGRREGRMLATLRAPAGLRIGRTLDLACRGRPIYLGGQRVRLGVRLGRRGGGGHRRGDDQRDDGDDEAGRHGALRGGGFDLSHDHGFKAPFPRLRGADRRPPRGR